MAKFPIVRTERTVSGRGPSVRADLDVRTGAREVAEAVSGLGEALFGIGLKRQQMTDANSSVQAQKLRNLADEEYKQFKAVNPQEMWQGFRREQTERVGREVGNLPFSPFALEEERIRSEMYSEVSTAEALTEATLQLRRDTIDALTEDLVDAFRSNDPQRITDSSTRFIANGNNMGMDKIEVLNAVKAAKVAGERLREKDAISEVHAAIEVGEETGNFDLAIELAKNPSISEPKQTTLRNTIDAAIRSWQTQIELAIEQKDNEIGSGFLELLANKLEPNKPQLSFKMIVDSELSQDAKEEWFGKLRVFDNYSEQELKEAFTDKGEVLAEIYDRIDKGIITDNEIRAFVGEGLSAPTAQRIIRERRAPYEKDTEQLFKRIFGWSPELGFENDFAGFLYEKALREWQAEVKEQNVTGEDIIKIGRSIVRPYLLEHIKKVMPFDTDVARMMDLALGEETEKLRPPKPIEAEEPMEEPVEPLTLIDFESEVSRLKGIDMVKAKEYYDTWIGKFREE